MELKQHDIRTFCCKPYRSALCCWCRGIPVWANTAGGILSPSKLPGTFQSCGSSIHFRDLCKFSVSWRENLHGTVSLYPQSLRCTKKKKKKKFNSSKGEVVWPGRNDQVPRELGCAMSLLTHGVGQATILQGYAVQQEHVQTQVLPKKRGFRLASWHL